MAKMDERKRSTYRFNLDLEKLIEKEAQRLGVSKNAYVQMKLMEIVKNNPKNG